MACFLSFLPSIAHGDALSWQLPLPHNFSVSRAGRTNPREKLNISFAAARRRFYDLALDILTPWRRTPYRWVPGSCVKFWFLSRPHVVRHMQDSRSVRA